MNESRIQKIGFVGLGNFGLPIAMRCLDRGYEVYGYSFRGRGVRGVDSLTKVGGLIPTPETLSELDALILCLLRSSDVEQVINEWQDRLPAVIIDLTTGHPEDTAVCYRNLRDRGVLLVDCPVSGSKEGARNGQLTLFIGMSQGEHEAVDRFLQDIGANLAYFGVAGRGNSAKLINQLMHLSIMGVIGDALDLASKLDLDLQTMVSALKTSSGNSAMLTRFGDSIVQGDFTPHFSLELAVKDVFLVDDLAKRLQAVLPYHQVTKDLFEAHLERGEGTLNFSVVCKKYM
jgi:3-hydroxyisobutyrate dehydrogenase